MNNQNNNNKNFFSNKNLFKKNSNKNLKSKKGDDGKHKFLKRKDKDTNNNVKDSNTKCESVARDKRDSGSSTPIMDNVILVEDAKSNAILM